MKPMTNLQKQAYSRLKGMLHAFLAERNAEKALSYFTNDVQGIGCEFQEVVFGKNELREIMIKQIEQDPFPFQFTPKNFMAVTYNNGRLISAYVVIDILKTVSGTLPFNMKTQLSVQFCKKEEEYYIRTFHISMFSEQPASNTDPIHFNKETIKENQDAINSNLFHFLNETMPGGIIGSYNETGYPFYFVNNRMLKYLGYTYDEFLEMIRGHIINSIHPADRAYVEATVEKAFQESDTYTVTYRMIKKGGSLVWVYEKGRRVLTESGREAIISVCFDITAQVEAKNELSFIAQSQIGGIFKARVDEGFTVLYANECYYQIHALTKERMEKQYHNQAALLVHPDDIAAVSEQLQRAIEENQASVALEYRVIRGDGKIAWLHASAGLNNTNDGIILSGMVINIDERKSFEQRLQWSEKKFQIALEQTNIKVWEYDLSSRSLVQSEKSYHVFGDDTVIPNVPKGQIQNGDIHPDDVNAYIALYEKLHQGEPSAEAVIRLRAAEDKYCWEKIKYTNIFDENGVPVRAIAASIDITAQKEAECRFFQEEQLREMLSADMLLSAKINLTRNKVLYVWGENYRLETLDGLSSYEQLNAAIMQVIATPGDCKRFAERFDMQSVLQAANNGERSIYGEYRCQTGEGQILWCAFHLVILADPETCEQLVFCYIRDIDERKKTELALQERAEHDALTGLYNRQTVESMIKQRLSQQQHSETQAALFILDIDNFKQINDRFGHLLGDQILQEVGSVISIECHSKSIAGRLGGDEFIIFTEEIPNRRWARKTAAKVCEKLRFQYDVDGEAVQTSVSIGLVTANPGSVDYSNLFQAADSALYDAKARGKGRISIHDSLEMKEHNVQFLNSTCPKGEHPSEKCMLNELEDSVIIIDEEAHDILYMNSAAQKVFHVDEYENKKCYHVLQGFSQPCVFCRSHLPEESNYQAWENTNAQLHKRFLIRDKMIPWHGRRARLEIFTDLSEYSSLSETQLQSDHVLMECVSLLLTTDSMETAMKKVLENLGRYYYADRVSYVNVAETDELHDVTLTWKADRTVSVEQKSEEVVCGCPDRWKKALRNKRSLVFHEADFEKLKALFPEKAADLQKSKAAAYIAAALLDEGELVGYFNLENPRRNKNNTTLLQSTAHLVHVKFKTHSLQKQQRFLQYHDAMTGLLNWRSFSQTLSCLHPETLSSLGVVILDINHLRLLNQSCGAAYGNELIQTLARAIQNEFGPAASFRISGDIFLALCPDISHDALHLKLDLLRAKIEENYPNHVSFSCSWNDHDLQPNQIINDAFELLSVVKNEEGEQKQVNKLHTMRLQRLTQALEKKYFQVYLQPKADIKTDKIIGAEALIRYVGENRCVVTPDKFIPQLEAENNIRYIDFFVLEEVCRMMQARQKKGKRVFPISMNFSRNTLMEENIVEKINAVTDRYHIDRSLIEIEITESTGEINRYVLTEVSRKLTKAGYRLFLDDFGTEYSNLSVLSVLSLNGLKLDKSIIRDLYSNPTTKLLVESLIQVCQKMNIVSIAEGVEEPEQLEILKAIGCNIAQGYLFNKPIPVADFERKYLDYYLPIL